MKVLVALAFSALCLPCFAAETKLRVFVANYPLKYFAERIGGQHLAVGFPAPKNQDPPSGSHRMTRSPPTSMRTSSS